MATITVERTITADPTSAALLLAGLTRVPPLRRPTSYVTRFPLADVAAVLTLHYAAPGATVASLALSGPVSGADLRAVATAFLDDLANAAEARADAA